uniref:Uncharacterized protein n=1 Tax=Rhizophagus irregularis (strain DAOM 181602 / DAOM 197198 / MUCL 43194) TaxID=747089 RepID=U9SM09_RHIID
MFNTKLGNGTFLLVYSNVTYEVQPEVTQINEKRCYANYFGINRMALRRLVQLYSINRKTKICNCAFFKVKTKCSGSLKLPTASYDNRMSLRQFIIKFMADHNHSVVLPQISEIFIFHLKITYKLKLVYNCNQAFTGIAKQ